MAWDIDPHHSEVMFFSKTCDDHDCTRDIFNVISGSLHIDEQNPANSWVDAQADTSSVNTRDERRDGTPEITGFLRCSTVPNNRFQEQQSRTCWW